MPLLRSILLNLVLVASLLIIIYALYQVDYLPRLPRPHQQLNRTFTHVVITFTKSAQNPTLKRNARRMITTLLRNTNESVHFHVVTDRDGGAVVRHAVQITRKDARVTTYSVLQVAGKLRDLIAAMQTHFSPQPGGYYSDVLFFLSIGLHRVLPQHLKRVIVLDVDLEFRADIRDLASEFDKFGPAILGASPELSPVYRHVLYTYRGKNPGTSAGNPSNPGVNSGVLLLDLEVMRASWRYNEYLDAANVTSLATKYHFRGHLGDQDFYTLLSYDWPEGIYKLPCTWNRQLCQWWEQHGYKDVFQEYFQCNGEVKVYHGNCNSPIPEN